MKIGNCKLHVDLFAGLFPFVTVPGGKGEANRRIFSKFAAMLFGCGFRATAGEIQIICDNFRISAR